MGSFWLREESGREGENSAETKVGATMPDRNYRDVKKLVFGAYFPKSFISASPKEEKSPLKTRGRTGTRPSKKGHGPLVVMYPELPLLKLKRVQGKESRGIATTLRSRRGHGPPLVLGRACATTQLAQSVEQKCHGLQLIENSNQYKLHVPLLCWTVHTILELLLQSEPDWIGNVSSSHQSGSVAGKPEFLSSRTTSCHL
jgi:hypothetical protein